MSIQNRLSAAIVATLARAWEIGTEATNSSATGRRWLHMQLPLNAKAALISAIILVIPSGLTADESSWLEINGTVYGASPDSRGPIGGGKDYTPVVVSGDITAKDAESLVDALAQATPGQTVFIPGNLEIDLTTLIYIEQLVLDVPGGVTLASDRGRDGSPGALLTSDALKMPVMLRALGPNVRITGLRLRGPNAKRYLDHHRRSFNPKGDGHKYYYKFPVQDGITTVHEKLEVDNCEISGFGHAAIFLKKGAGHCIHHNFIHHCQYNGLGYGISHNVASSVIEFNLFDWNRHSIAGTGRPGCTYVARHNIELGTSLSHCFDMHGGRDREDGTEIAGTSIKIYNNTFRASHTPVVIRGVPQEQCDVFNNWFPTCSEPKQAVHAAKNTHVHDNAYRSEQTTVQ